MIVNWTMGHLSCSCSSWFMVIACNERMFFSFCTDFRSKGRKKTSSHLKYLNPIILKVCLESDRGLIRQILATQPRLGPRPPSLSPQSRSRGWSRGRDSGGDIVDLVLLDTSSVNMKRALFWKSKKSNKRFIK